MSVTVSGSQKQPREPLLSRGKGFLPKAPGLGWGSQQKGRVGQTETHPVGHGGHSEGHSAGLCVPVLEGSLLPQGPPKLDERNVWGFGQRKCTPLMRGRGETQVEISGRGNVLAKAQGQGTTGRWHFKDASLKWKQ